MCVTRARGGSGRHNGGKKMAVCFYLLPIDAQIARIWHGGQRWTVGWHGRQKLYKMPFSGCHNFFLNDR